MGTLSNSIIRGFGSTIGRHAANSILTPKYIASPRQIDCYSHEGYQEGDVEIAFDIKWRHNKIKFIGWLGYIIFPVLNLPFAINRAYMVFVKKYNMHFYNLEWQERTISDARYKTGLRQLKELKPIYDKSAHDEPPADIKRSTIIVLVYSIITTIAVLYNIFYVI